MPRKYPRPPEPRNKKAGATVGSHGRQEPYDREACLKIIFDELSTSSKGLHKIIAADADLPSVQIFWRWLDNDIKAGSPENLAGRYQHAKKLQAEFMENELLSIADDEPSVTDKGNVDGGDVKHKELRIKTRQWLMGRLDSKKYGDRQILSGDPESPLNPPDLSKLTNAELEMFMNLRQKMESP